MYRYRVMVRVLGSGRLLYQRIFNATSDADAVRRGVNAVHRTSHRRRIPGRYLGWTIHSKRGLEPNWTLVTSYPAPVRPNAAPSVNGG